jgi:hypothetical protein
MTEKSREPSRVPVFKTVQEAAEFWDTHSTAEFEGEWEPADLQFAPNWRSVRLVSVKLEYSLCEQLRDLAREQDMTAEELVAAWIGARLASPAAAPPDG